LWQFSGLSGWAFDNWIHNKKNIYINTSKMVSLY
jgi:hypothetical protein